MSPATIFSLSAARYAKRRPGPLVPDFRADALASCGQAAPRSTGGGDLPGESEHPPESDHSGAWASGNGKCRSLRYFSRVRIGDDHVAGTYAARVARRYGVAEIAVIENILERDDHLNSPELLGVNRLLKPEVCQNPTRSVNDAPAGVTESPQVRCRNCKRRGIEPCIH